MKIKFEFESEEEREEFFRTLAFGAPEGTSVDAIEEDLTDKFLMHLGQLYLRSMRQLERESKRLSIERLKMFRSQGKAK